MYAEDNVDKIKGVGRMLRSMALAPVLDPEDLTAVFSRVQEDLDQALILAVTNLRQQGHSWAAIGAGLGVSRQAAHKTYTNACRVMGVPA